MSLSPAASGCRSQSLQASQALPPSANPCFLTLITMNLCQPIKRLKIGKLNLTKEAKQWLSKIDP